MSSTFRSLRERNARWFFSGMLISNIGTWVQMTAMQLVVYKLTGRGTSLGFNMLCQFLPMALFGAWCGALADRSDRWRMTLITQSLFTVQALTVGVLSLTGHLPLNAVYGLSLLLGVINAFDNPARRGLVTEFVDPADMVNAMSLNTAVMTGSRIVGPALGAILVGSVGAGWCFIANAGSYLAVLAALLRMDTSKLRKAPTAARGGTPVRDALRYIWSDRRLRMLAIVLVIVSTFAFNYSVSIPLIAAQRFGDVKLYGWLLAVMSVGSVCGSLYTASRPVVTMRWFVASVAILGIGGVAFSFAPNVWLGYLATIPIGFGGAGFIAGSNAILQQHCPPDMRGRLLAFTAVAFLGSTPVGSPITGWIGDHLGSSWSLAYGSLIALMMVAWMVRSLLGARDRSTPNSAVDGPAKVAGQSVR
jgi:MFS family permease